MGEIGFKGFKKGFTCRDKQYTVFEEPEARVCYKGMHYCKNPFDVLDYYDLVNEDGSFNEFAMVEPIAEEKTNDGKKFCATKLRIGAKFSFSGFVKACVDFVIEKTKYEKFEDNQEDCARIGSSGDDARIGSSSNHARIGSSGDDARIGSSGDFVRIDSSGNSAQIGSSGDDARIGSSGNSVQIGSSGDDAHIDSSGYCARIGSSGDYTRIGSSGDDARIGSSGDDAQIGSSGNSARIGSSGNCAQIGSSGDDAHIGSSGNHARIDSSGYCARIGSSGDSAHIGSSGDDAQIDSTGKYSVVMCAGHNCKVKAKIGSFITLAEWEYLEETSCYIPINVKTEKVDGERIKPDTYYKLENGKFVETLYCRKEEL